jgi:NAD(P)H-hydrate repair Nnr-like enzyme with NAD(P)H-hydrate dehydratase domain
MLAIVGTIPDPGVDILDGPVVRRGQAMFVEEQAVDTDRGTPALLASALAACEFLGLDVPHALLVGDEGLGHGSRNLYRHLSEVLPGRNYTTMAYHYLQPDTDWHDRVLLAMQSMATMPKIVADAGFMYAAKMSGQSGVYDLFTPDAGELAFLADPDAPHPFYTRGFILHDDQDVPARIAEAYEHGNSARCLLVKGGTDRVAQNGRVLYTVNGTRPGSDSPMEAASMKAVEAMEAMGGTGDTITGMAAALMESGMAAPEAAHVAAQANRVAGDIARPTPASQIHELIQHIPAALERVMKQAG